MTQTLLNKIVIRTRTRLSQARQAGLSRNVIALGGVSFFTDISTEVVYPLLPLFLTALGAGPAFVGLVEGVAETTASLLKLVAGWLSDRLGRRKGVVLFGYGLSSLTRPAMALALAPWHVLAVRFVDRVGKGFRGAPRDALIADSTEPAFWGRAFGFHRAMDHAGAVVGPLIAFILLQTIFQNDPSLEAFRSIFWIATIPAGLAMLVLFLAVREVKPPTGGRQNLPQLTLKPFNPTFRTFLLILVIFTLGNSSDAFLLLRANDLGVAPAWIPILWVVLHLVKSLSSMPGSGWSDRVGRRIAILVGWAIYALIYVGFALASLSWQIWALFGLYGIYFGLTEGSERALIADLTPPELRSTAYGVHGFTIGMAALPASLLMGGLWSQFGPQVAFLFGSSLALLAMLLLATLPSLRSLHI
jgi:MFS family permease